MGSGDQNSGPCASEVSPSTAEPFPLGGLLCIVQTSSCVYVYKSKLHGRVDLLAK